MYCVFRLCRWFPSINKITSESQQMLLLNPIITTLEVLLISIFSTNQPTGSIWSTGLHIRPSACMFVCPLALSFSQRCKVCPWLGDFVPFPCNSSNGAKEVPGEQTFAQINYNIYEFIILLNNGTNNIFIQF